MKRPAPAWLNPKRWAAPWRGARGRLFELVLLVMLPALAVQVLGAWNSLQQDLSQNEAALTRELAHAQGDFHTLLDETRIVFAGLMQLNEMRNPDNCPQMFNPLRLAYERLAPAATNIGLSDMQGNVYCAVKPMLGDLNIAAQPYFQAALQTLDFSVGDYTLNPLTGEPVLAIAYPALSYRGQVQAVMFVTYDLKWLEVWQNEVALPEAATLTLIAPDDSILIRYQGGQPVSGAGERANGSATEAAWYAPLQAGQAVVEAADLDGVKRQHSLAPLVYGSHSAASLHLGYPVEQFYAQINRSLGLTLALLALTLLTALLLAWWGSETLFLRPLRELMGAVGQIQAGDLHARAGEARGLKELAHLGQAFDRMAAALLQRETARQEAQTELQESEERFRAVLDNAAVGVSMMTLDRRIVQMNQAAARITGYSAEEMHSINPTSLAVEADRGLDRQLFAELVEGRRDQYTVEKRYIRKDGTLFWGRVNFSAVRGPEGKPLYTIGMIEDITEEKEAAARLAAQDAEHRSILEQRIAERTAELNQANELLQRKAAQDAVASERSRLARELHDAVTQTLFSATLIAEVLPDLWEMNLAEGRRRLAELGQLTRGALAEMRALLVELRPNALVEVPLPTLLRQLTEAITGRARINVQLNVDGGCRLPGDVQVALYRVGQEALNNIVKHSHATQAMVTLRLGPLVRLTIADNGAGFDPASVGPDHLGLKIMRERAEAIGAQFSIYSEPGEGAQVSVIWEQGEAG